MKPISQVLSTQTLSGSNDSNSKGTPSGKKLTPQVTRVSLYELESMWRVNPIIFNGLNKIIQTLMGSPHTLSGGTPSVRKFFKKFIENIGRTGNKLGWEELLSRILFDQVLYGWCFVENIYDENEPKIVDWDILDAKRMDYLKNLSSSLSAIDPVRNEGHIIMDKNGSPLGYTQVTSPYNYAMEQDRKSLDPSITKYLATNQIFFRPDQIALFKLFTAGDSFYPIGLVEPSYVNSVQKLNIKESITQSYLRHGAPILLAKLGDSVLGTRTTYVRKDGVISIVTFEEFYDSIDAPVSINQHILIKDVEGYETLSVNSSQEIEWKPIKKVSKHKYTDPLIHLQQKFGETIVTDQHSVYDEEFNLVEAGTNPKLYGWRGGLSGNEEERITLPELEIYSSPYANSKTVMPKEFSGKDLEDFCYVLGAYASEGHSSYHRCGNKDSYQITISNTNKEWLENLKEITDRLFGLQGYIQFVQQDKLDCYRLRYSSKYLHYLFQYYCSRLSEHKTLPEFIYGLQEKYKYALLQSLIEGDGHRPTTKECTKEYLKEQFEYCTISQKLAAGLSLMLNSLGIDFSIRYKETSAGNTAYQFRRVQKTRSSNGKYSMEEVPFDGFVYDLEVEDNHNFFDGLGMILCHNTNHEPTPSQIQNVLGNLKQLDSKTEIAVPYYYDIDFLEAKAPTEIQDQLNAYEDDEVASLGVPGPYVKGSGESTNRATLTNQDNLFRLSLRDLIRRTCESIRRCMFIPVAESHGIPIEKVPCIEWDVVGVEETGRKTDRILDYVKEGILTPEQATALITKIEPFDMEDLTLRPVDK